jgi:hypothetical protein
MEKDSVISKKETTDCEYPTKPECEKSKRFK